MIEVKEQKVVLQKDDSTAFVVISKEPTRLEISYNVNNASDVTKGTCNGLIAIPVEFVESLITVLRNLYDE